jgi:hypothetical protein
MTESPVFVFMAKRKAHWMQKVAEGIKSRGTSGAFGKATPKKIARAKAHGGLQAKRAVLAENFEKPARKGKRGHRSR